MLDLNAGFVDRNRAALAPFFCGNRSVPFICENRFEFRALGSAQNVDFPLAVLNTVTEGMSKLWNMIVVSFQNVSVYQAKSLFADVELSKCLSLLLLYNDRLYRSTRFQWQALAAHQSIKEYEFQDYIFASATDENGKTIIGGKTEFLEYIFTLNIEENRKIFNEGVNKNRTEFPNMTVHVRTINGKTISVKRGMPKDGNNQRDKQIR